MENVVTGHYADHLTEPGKVVVDGGRNQTERYPGSSCPDKDGLEVSQRDSPASPGSGQSGHACLELTHPSTTEHDPVAEQEEDFVHVDGAPTTTPTQGSPENWNKYPIGVYFVGRLHDGNANHAPQPDYAPDIGQSSSGPPHSTTETAPVAGQGKEELLGLHTENTVPYGSFSSKSRNQYPPGMYYDAQFPDEDTNDVPQHGPPVALGNEQSCPARLDPSVSLTKPAPVAERGEIPDAYTPNIVIFGETGVGKSSIINLIADQKLAGTSNDALGCTFQHKRYHIILENMLCALWDTTGLDEGTEGTVPARVAEKNLRELMRGLAHSGGIHLIIYCIRGTRLTKALKRNYDLFYVTVCRKKVPVALVVTGLEHQLGEMETWWVTNEAVLRRYGMQFDAHACVTTLNVEDRIIQQRRSDSRRLLRELVVEYSGRSGWKIDPWFISWVLPMFRSAFHGTSSMGGLGNTTTIRKVTICGSFTELLLGTTSDWYKSTVRIGDRQYEFIWVNKRILHTLTPRTLEDYGGLGAGVLVFFTSPLDDHRIPWNDVDALKRFYDIAGGQLCPVIIALQDRSDKEVAQTRWTEFVSHYRDIQAHLVCLPGALDDARAKLDEAIKDLYIEHVETKSSNLFRRIMAGKCISEFSYHLFLLT